MKSPDEGKRTTTWAALAPALVPALVFYAILWNTATALPIVDDYHAELAFTNQFAQLHGFWPKLMHVLTFQQNEYKLIFDNTVTAVQYLALGRVSLYGLAQAGNLFVVALFLVIAAAYRKSWRSSANPMLILLPVAFLVFQLQYASTMNWATCTLQNVAVLPFSLAAIFFLCEEAGPSFTPGCIAMVLAVASSGNGFMVVPIGGFLLWRRKRWANLGVWLGIAFLLIALYAVRYNVHASQTAPGASVWQDLLHINPVYILSFLGSSFAGYTSAVPSTIAGILMCGGLLLALVRRYDLKNPAIFYFMVFILLTACGVSGLRSNSGIIQSLASRYRIYSNLLLLFLLLFAYEVYWGRIQAPAKRKLVVYCVALGTLLFCAASDFAGYRFLHGRQRILAVAFYTAEQPGGADTVDAAAHGDITMLRQVKAGIYNPNLEVLHNSERLGVYEPPKP